MQNVFIRMAGSDDAELIANLSRKTFHDTFSPFNTQANMDKFMGEVFTTDKLMAEVGVTGNIFLLAYLDNEVAGYAKLKENNSPDDFQEFPSLEITRIYATVNSIGMGVGHALMQTILEIAKEKNKKLVWLGVWEKNLRAINFYIKWGFEKFGDHEFILGDDVQNDWLMKRLI